MSLRPPARSDELHTPETQDADVFLTVDEAAAVLKVKPSTVREWIRQGRLPCIRLGPRAIRLTPGILRSFAARNFDAGRGF